MLEFCIENHYFQSVSTSVTLYQIILSYSMLQCNILSEEEFMKKWELKSEDFWNAKRYITRQLDKDLRYLELDFAARNQAIDEFNNNTRNARMLQEWMEKYLTNDQIRKLRTFLRVEKSRSKRRLQTITIEEDVRKRLAEFAKSYSVTLSEAIDLLLKKCSNDTM